MEKDVPGYSMKVNVYQGWGYIINTSKHATNMDQAYAMSLSL